MIFEAAGATHVGLVRKKNEDSFLCDAENHAYAVADGLGGLPCGDLASKSAVQYLELWINSRKSENWTGIHWPTFMKELNQTVIETGQMSANGLGIGTTFTMGLIRDDILEVSHIGDSRVYLIRDDDIQQLSTDHTLETFAKEQNQFPEDSVPEHYKHTLTQCLGQRQLIKPQFLDQPLQADDRLLFCSDGISGPLSEGMILHTMTARNSAQATLDQLIHAALEKGAPDNVTAIIVFVR